MNGLGRRPAFDPFADVGLEGLPFAAADQLIGDAGESALHLMSQLELVG
jgi:hypothetical protein